MTNQRLIGQLIGALEDLVLRVDNTPIADGSNIETAQAHAVLEAVRADERAEVKAANDAADYAADCAGWRAEGGIAPLAREEAVYHEDGSGAHVAWCPCDRCRRQSAR